MIGVSLIFCIFQSTASANLGYILVPHDKRLIKTMAQESELSFTDVQFINTAYCQGTGYIFHEFVHYIILV